MKLPTDYNDEQIKSAIKKELGIQSEEFLFQILHKSLDARKKNDIHWLIRVRIVSRVRIASSCIKDVDAVIHKSHKELPNIQHAKKVIDIPSQKSLLDIPSQKSPLDIPSHESPLDIQYHESLLDIPYCKRREKVLVVGSGPAGFFAAFVLQKAGFNTTLIERGSKVKKREASIKEFESTGKFNPLNNYAFGEGGAGTFSDGKLTSRSKHISKEKQFVLSSYVQAGAPEEILYMAHPHLGSDHLKQIVKKLREAFINIGGTILFETMLQDLKIKNRKVVGAFVSSSSRDITEAQMATNSVSPESSIDEIEADEVVIAPGHSAYETYRMLISRGVQFKSKNFAIGCRVEHPQELINIAQWGQKFLPGVKAAEYRLTSKADGHLPVYTFCMCPGGVIVPSTAYETSNIVNGMSRYQRNGKFANAACVAGVNLGKLLSREVEATESLDWLESLEHRFYSYSSGYSAPFCSIQDFIDKKLRSRSYQSCNSMESRISVESRNSVESSYALGLKSAHLWELLPVEISVALRHGLKDFSRKLKGFETGLIMGLESKTSSPVSVLREKNGLCIGFDNLYLVGEGSGHSGGIVSSASDGIRAAMSIIYCSRP
ncbi:MAG: FAD-dependent monooxygenase [Desulfamplus sp.]|nr:FAD-dependent monooxygenase [Desulfamplus sp.]